MDNNVLVTVAGIGAAIYIARALYNENKKIHIVTNANECRRAVALLREDLKEYNVLGFDCEWVSTTRRGPVALLQLATHRGVCALIRLSHMDIIPLELQDLLADTGIIKVGVDSHRDATYLAQDHGLRVANTYDLRYMAQRSGYEPGGLGRMSERYVNVKLDKGEVTCSNWQAQQLSEQQIEYAAKDAVVAVKLFDFFAEKIDQKSFFESDRKYATRIINQYCQNDLDQPFARRVHHQ